MSHRGIRYGVARKNYIVNTLTGLCSKYRCLDTQKVIRIKNANKKSLEARSINS